MSQARLLAISEMGGYPNFTPLYESYGYEVLAESKMRKVLKLLKKYTPEVVVAEFNYQSDFRDRTSSLESLLSVIQRHPKVKVIIFYDKEHEAQLAKLQAQYVITQTIAFPIDKEMLEQSLQAL